MQYSNLNSEQLCTSAILAEKQTLCFQINWDTFGNVSPFPVMKNPVQLFQMLLG